MGLHDLIAFELHRWRGSSIVGGVGSLYWRLMVGGCCGVMQRCMIRSVVVCYGALGCVVVLPKLLWFFVSVVGCGVCHLLCLDEVYGHHFGSRYFLHT